MSKAELSMLRQMAKDSGAVLIDCEFLDLNIEYKFQEPSLKKFVALVIENKKLREANKLNAIYKNGYEAGYKNALEK